MLKNVIRLWQIRSNVYLNFLYTFQLFFILQFNAYILIWCAQRRSNILSKFLFYMYFFKNNFYYILNCILIFKSTPNGYFLIKREFKVSITVDSQSSNLSHLFNTVIYQP